MLLLVYNVTHTHTHTQTHTHTYAFRYRNTHTDIYRNTCMHFYRSYLSIIHTTVRKCVKEHAQRWECSWKWAMKSN